MLNRNQIFLLIIATCSILAAYYFLETDFYVSIILLVISFVTVVLVGVYKSKPQTLVEQNPEPKTHEEPQFETVEVNPTHPDIIQPNYRLSPTPQPQGLGGVLSTTLDRFFSEADVTSTITLKVELPPEIDYHGDKLKIAGNLEIKINGTKKTGKQNKPASPTNFPTSTPTQAPVQYHLEEIKE